MTGMKGLEMPLEFYAEQKIKYPALGWVCRLIYLSLPLVDCPAA